MADYANPDSLVTTDWVAQHLNDPKGPPHRGRCRHRRLRYRPRARRRRLELEERPRDARRPRRRRQRGHREAALPGRRRQGHDDRPLRRQQQLVRRLRPLAAQVLRRREREADERRPQEVGRRGPPDRHRQAEPQGYELQGVRPRQEDPHLPRGRPQELRQEGRRPRRRARAEGVLRRAAGPGEPAAGRARSVAATSPAPRTFPGARP